VEKSEGANSFEAVARKWLGTHATRWTPGYSEKIIRRSSEISSQRSEKAKMPMSIATIQSSDR
jgi:hypothetical protein